MNKVLLTGFISKDPEIKTASSGVKIARFTIAVKRRFKSENGEYNSDFFNCTAFRTGAEFIEKYLGNGSRVAVAGKLENRTYEANGEKKYFTEIVVDEIEGQSKDNGDKVKLTPVDDEEIPF